MIKKIIHKFGLWKLGIGRGAQYRNYLDVQFERSFQKKEQPVMFRAEIMIGKLLEFGNAQSWSRILCIGPRNKSELDCFRANGFQSVTGIDLFSESADIIVMDMHHMSFPDESFDVIFASHSLEHATDIRRVAKEILRVIKPGGLVAIEMPVKYETRGADIIDIGDLDSLYRVFEPHIKKVIWSDEQSPYSKLNESGTSVIRTIFEAKISGRPADV